MTVAELFRLWHVHFPVVLLFETCLSLLYHSYSYFHPTSLARLGFVLVSIHYLLT